MPSRRQVLAHLAIGTAASSGCLLWDTRDDSALALHFEPVDASDLGEEFLFTAAEWSATQRQLVGDGVPNGTARYGHRPLRGGEFVEVDGTYYAVDVAENGTETVARPVLRAERVSGVDGEARGFADLSREDALTLRCAVATSSGEGPEPCAVLHAGEESAFWPDPPFEYWTNGDDSYHLTVSEQNVTLTRFDYTFRPVARSRPAFADYAARELLAADYDSMDLTAEQRDILRAAAREGVYRESPPPYSDEFLDLVDAFRAGADSARDYVRFDGAYFLARTTEFHDD